MQLLERFLHFLVRYFHLTAFRGGGNILVIGQRDVRQDCHASGEAHAFVFLIGLFVQLYLGLGDRLDILLGYRLAVGGLHRLLQRFLAHAIFAHLLLYRRGGRAALAEPLDFNLLTDFFRRLFFELLIFFRRQLNGQLDAGIG